MGRHFVLQGRFLILVLFFFLRIIPVLAQKPLHGKVFDMDTNQPVAGASIRCVTSDEGTSSDRTGAFMLLVPPSVKEVLVDALGYEEKVFEVGQMDTVVLIYLRKEKRQIEAVEISKKQKYNKRNPATAIIDLVIAHKKDNKLSKKDSLFYRQYEKLKVGLVEPSKKLASKMGEMSFFFKNLDSTVVKDKEVMAIYLQENVSDNFVKQDPHRTKKIIIAEQKTVFDPRYINNNNIESYLGTIMQAVDVYDESIYFLNKLFLSPIANNAKLYYKYQVVDTVWNGHDFSIRLRFEPFNKQDLLFSGDMLISMDGRYAVEHASLVVGKEVNLSWINGLEMELSYFKNEEGVMLQDTSRVLFQFGTKRLNALFGERLSIKEDYDLNYPLSAAIFKGAPVEQKILPDISLNQLRPIELSVAEQATYVNVSQLNQMRSFRTIISLGYLLAQGYYNLGKIELGPLEYVYHQNKLEGSRVRLGGRTTAAFSERVYLQGYLAYGLKDEQVKYYLRSAVSLNSKPVSTFPAHYLEGIIQHDVLAPGRGIGFLIGDSFFRSFGGNRPNKWLNTNAYRLGHRIEFGNHISLHTSFTHQRRDPVGDYRFISSADHSSLLKHINTNDIEVNLRWAPFERFYYRNLERTTIIENHPVFNIQYNKGLKGFWDADYNYDALRLSVSKRFFMNQLGFGDATVTAGKIWGVLPYPLLEIPNIEDEVDRHSISYERTNTMEFVADQFIKFSYDHHFDGFILNKLPLIKRLKLRESLGVKMFYGRLSDVNNPFKSDRVVHFDLDDKGNLMTNILGTVPYWEGYVGIANIFKLFKVDYYKRLNYSYFPNVEEKGFWKNLRVSFRVEF